MLVRLAHSLHRATGAICVALLAALACAEIAVVLLRYVYGIGFLQLQDFASYSFAALVVLGLPYALARDAHVRVDIWRERQSPSTRKSIDYAGLLLLLAPVFTLTLYSVWPDVRYAWEIREGSRETGGLGGLYLVKSCLPLSCALMLIQGLAMLFCDARPLAGEPDDER